MYDLEQSDIEGFKTWQCLLLGPCTEFLVEGGGSYLSPSLIAQVGYDRNCLVLSSDGHLENWVIKPVEMGTLRPEGRDGLPHGHCAHLFLCRPTCCFLRWNPGTLPGVGCTRLCVFLSQVRY